MKRLKQKLVCALTVAIGFSAKVDADEYIKLFAKVQGESWNILSKKHKDYDLSKSPTEIDNDISNDLLLLKDNLVLKDEDVYDLNDGEAIELTRPLFQVYQASKVAPRIYDLGWTPFKPSGKDSNFHILSQMHFQTFFHKFLLKSKH